MHKRKCQVLLTLTDNYSQIVTDSVRQTHFVLILNASAANTVNNGMILIFFSFCVAYRHIFAKLLYLVAY
jgi:hypothetical protein